MITIQIANSMDIGELIPIFCEAFNDTNDDVANFYMNAVSNENILVARFDGNICGMIHLLPSGLMFNGKKHSCGYIYGLAVKKEYRHRGVMLELEKAACSYALEKGIGTVFLVPQTRGLFKMYEKLGYKTIAHSEKMTVIPQYVSDFSLSSCEKEVFFTRRKSFLQRKATFFDLAGTAAEYRFTQATSEGEVLFYRDFKSSGYIVGVKDGSHYTIKETDLLLEAIPKAAYALTLSDTRIKTISVYGMGKRAPFAMAKSIDGSVNIFDLMLTNPYCMLMLE